MVEISWNQKAGKFKRVWQSEDGSWAANTGYTARELTDHLKITEAKFILTELKALDNSVAGAKECDIPDANISPIMELLLQHGEQDWVEVDDPSTPAAYVSTNETMGLPKSAIIPHSYLDSQAAIIEKLLPAKKNISYLISIPPFHLFTIHVQHHLPLRSNMTAYNLPRFEETSFVKTVETFKIARTMAVLPMLLALPKYPPARLGSLKQILIGGFPLPLGLHEDMYAKPSPQARIIIVYGMTEAGWETFWRKKEKDTTGSIGERRHREGNILKKERANWEIQIYNPLAMTGYLNNPAATVEGFMHARQLDPRWRHRIHERQNLVGVIGIPSPDGCGESPMAFIVAEKGSILDETQIKLFLATRPARYKNMEEVCFVDIIPRNPIGKILRRAAAQEYSGALQQLDKYEQLKGSESKPSVVNVSSDETKVNQKIKVSSTAPIRPWRKMRVLSFTF
ncbi:acetyl-CoA synthetase-like protein [Hyaloscypha variabilis]